jgi:opacity protein-like surface antigen
MRKAILGTFFLLIAEALVYPQHVSFKLTGGLAWINGDDYNSGIVGENKYIKDTTQTMSGAYEMLKNGLNFQFEIINYLNPRLGIGIGGGYYRLANESRVTSQGVLSDVPFETESTYKARISVIPFFLNFHYIARLTTKTSLDIYAGPLFQIVQFNFENPSTTSILSTEHTVTFTASKTSLGLQGGLGLNYEISSGVALIAEACYRQGKIWNIMGNWADLGNSASGPISQSSSEYYMWAYDDVVQGKANQRIGFFDANGPVGDSLSGARKTGINLSGLTALAGVKFSF